MVMVTVLKYLESNRNFHTPKQSSWEKNACFRKTYQGTTKDKNYSLIIGQKPKLFHYSKEHRKWNQHKQSQMDAFENVTGSSELNFFFT